MSAGSKSSVLPQDTQPSHVRDSSTSSTYKGQMTGRSQYSQPSQGSGSSWFSNGSQEQSDLRTSR